MKQEYRNVRLGSLLKRAERFEDKDPLKEYQFAGTYSFARGIFAGERKFGSSFQLPRIQRVRKGDFIYCKIMAWEGAFGIAPEEVDNCVLSGAFVVYDIDRSQVDEQYLAYYFKIPEMWKSIGEQSTGTNVRRRSLHPEQFEDTLMSLPPLEEQCRIVARIEELAGKVEEARGLREKALMSTEKIIASAVSHLSFDEASWTNMYASVLSSKGSVRSGPFGSQLHHDEFVDTGIAAIGTRDVQVHQFVLKSGWYITPQKFEQFKRYQVFPGDILGTIVGASIGRFCVVPENVPLAFTTKHVIAVTLDQSRFLPDFVSYFLNFHERCRKSLFSKIEGSAQPSLNSTKILETEIPFPPLSEQARIVAYLDDLQAKTDGIKQHQARTQGELDGLLPSILDKAFRGELV